jgi:hypothetical protein
MASPLWLHLVIGPQKLKGRYFEWYYLEPRSASLHKNAVYGVAIPSWLCPNFFGYHFPLQRAYWPTQKEYLCSFKAATRVLVHVQDFPLFPISLNMAPVAARLPC